jgi:hypothetical protein
MHRRRRRGRLRSAERGSEGAVVLALALALTFNLDLGLGLNGAGGDCDCGEEGLGGDDWGRAAEAEVGDVGTDVGRDAGEVVDDDSFFCGPSTAWCEAGVGRPLYGWTGGRLSSSGTDWQRLRLAMYDGIGSPGGTREPRSAQVNTARSIPGHRRWE